MINAAWPRSSATVGCINVVPGVWEPQWVRAELLVYNPPLEHIITLLFHDEGEPFQHAIDLQGAGH